MTPKSNQDFFTTLPLEIVMDILARLPVRTVLNCMYVCKSWLSLITGHEFSKLHPSTSVPLLAFYQDGSSLVEMPRPHAYSLFEVEEGPDHELYFNPVAKVNLPNLRWICIRGSVDGLLFLLDKKSPNHEVFLICNPITREYVKLPYPQTVERTRKVKNRKRKVKNHEITCGFGASKTNGQLKVVRIFQEWWEKPEFDCDCERYTMFIQRHTLSREHHCEVHTLGTGTWRRIPLAPTFHYIDCNMSGLFLNGNLHWLVVDKNGSSLISCFDLETELFNTFSTPKLGGDRAASLTTLGDCLCLSDNRYDIVIWLMKEYGDGKSWTKDFVISQSPRLKWDEIDIFYPIKVLNDGSLLIASNGRFLVQYSKKNGGFLVLYPWKKGILLSMSCRFQFRHTPSYLSLKHLGMENVRSL